MDGLVAETGFPDTDVFSTVCSTVLSCDPELGICKGARIHQDFGPPMRSLTPFP